MSAGPAQAPVKQANATGLLPKHGQVPSAGAQGSEPVAKGSESVAEGSEPLAKGFEPVASLLDHLRCATEQAHAAIHQHPVMRACLEEQLTLAQYHQLLSAFYGLWQALIASIDQVPIAELILPLQSRFSAIAQDLVQLESLPHICPRASDRSSHSQHCGIEINSAAQSLGLCYVLVGSSLGAGVLVQHVKAALPGAPVAYLGINAQAAGWPLLVPHLRALRGAITGPECLAARQAFRTLHYLLDGH